MTNQSHKTSNTNYELKLKKRLVNKQEMDRKFKICLVANSYPKYRPGGSEVQLYYIGRELVKLGYQVHFTTLDFGQKTSKVTVDDGMIIHKAKFWLHRRPPFFRFLLVLKAINTDIYINRAFRFTMVTFIFTKIFKRKFVYAIASESDCIPQKIEKKVLWLPSFFQNIRRWADQHAMLKADLIIAQANYQKYLLLRNFGVNSIVIKNGHPIPDKLIKKDNPVMALWLGSLKRLRQAEIFIELAKRCQHLNCKFILAGRPSDKGYLTNLLNQMKGLSNILYMGSVTLEQSNELIGRAAIFVNTSLWEGFPNTFIQAWMRKTPTVSLKVDPDNIIKIHKLGFHSKTFNQLVKDVQLLIANEDLRIQMGENAWDYAIKEHDITKISRELLDAMKRI